LTLAFTALAMAGCGASGGGAETTAAAVSSDEADLAGTVEIGGGRKMYLECRGSGSPTVVLVSGLDTAADLWNIPGQPGPKVFPALSRSTRVCAYDRPGAPLAVGGPSRSDPVAQPTSPEDAVSDLHALLAAAGVPGPYVLVGHSYGGIVSRLFAATNPDEVSGMVLVDIVSPELRDSMTAGEWETWKLLNARKPEDIADYPDLERIEFDQSLDQIEAGGAIRQMPMVVLSADERYGPKMEAQAAEGELAGSVPADFGYVIDRANEEAQKQLAQLVTGAEHITETDSGHNMMIDNAPLVIDATRDTLDAIRAGRPTLTAPTETGADFAGLVDIGGGRQVWATCKGHGSPTVVLISGKGTGAEDWFESLDPDDPAHQTPGDDVSAGMGQVAASDDAVFPSIARTTRVCAYDRPDVRFSGEVTTPRPQPHTADLDVSDLHSLLAAIGEPGPYVLVAHSYGGLVAALYARTYPESVGGLVMVDTASEVMEDIVTPAALDRWDEANAATNDVVREGVMLKDAFARINAAGPMPKVPAIVLAADKPWRVDLIPPEQLQGEHLTFADWVAMVNRLGVNLGAKTITKTGSGHNIYLYNPKLVSDAIDEVVGDVRDASGRRDPAYCRAMRPTLGALVEDLKVPGAVVLVRSAKLGNCFLTFGTRSLAGDRPIGLNDQFRIGSNTKTMTGTVILQLVQEHKLSLDDPVSKYRDGVPNGENITIEQLLTMRSGLADYSASPELAQAMDATPDRVWTPEEVLALSFAQPPAFAPGQGYLYSNANTVLLGLIIEKVTGVPLEQAFAKRIFRPLGLTRTLLPARTSNALPRAHAQGYLFGTVAEFIEDDGVLPPDEAADANAGTLEPNDVTDVNPSWAWAAGAGISTTRDLARYVKALVAGELLNKKLQRQRLASVRSIDPDNPDSPAYGQAIVKYGELYGHTGELPGYNSFMGYDPKRDITVITWANLVAAPDGRLTSPLLSQAVIDALYPTP